MGENSSYMLLRSAKKAQHPDRLSGAHMQGEGAPEQSLHGAIFSGLSPCSPRHQLYGRPSATLAARRTRDQSALVHNQRKAGRR
jgi:hypothetical protein